MECQPLPVAESETVWDRIEKRLDDWGMTQAELARDSGVPKSTLTNWKKDRARTPDTDNLQAVARALQCRMEELTGEAPMPESAHRPLGRLSAAERRIVNACREDEALERAVLDLVRSWTTSRVSKKGR